MESTGNMILVGKENEDDAAAVHVLSFKDEWQKIATKSVPCSHNDFYIVPAMIENTEHLLLSCWKCEVIWFCGKPRGFHFIQTIKLTGHYPGPMCKAEGDYIYVVDMVEGSRTVLKVKCTPTELVVDKIKTIHSKMQYILFMEYLPGINCIVLSRWKENLVKAINCGTGEQVWEVKGEEEGVTWEPHGLLYLPEHQSLLVCDPSDNGRLVVVNPRNGSILQTTSLSEISVPISLSIHEGNIVLCNILNYSVKISVFAIK